MKYNKKIIRTSSYIEIWEYEKQFLLIENIRSLPMKVNQEKEEHLKN